jgi:hypothetical protein
MELSAPPEEELRQAARAERPTRPTRSILVAPQDANNLESLLDIAQPLAKSTPPRELILAEIVVPARYVTGVLYDQKDINDANVRLNERRRELMDAGIATRAVAFNSVVPGQDYVRLASEQEVDLILLDGRQSLLTQGLPSGAAGVVLQKAPCDVGILVDRKGAPQLDPDHPIYVPFGGAMHDWAALELAAWIATMQLVPLRLLGATSGNGADASAVLGDASLVVQQFGGIQVEPKLVDLSNGGLIEATKDAGLLVIGLSERWRNEGLGPLRSEIAKRASAPILFVRRGSRPGALAPTGEDVKRFTWSRAAGTPPVVPTS